MIPGGIFIFSPTIRQTFAEEIEFPSFFGTVP